MSETPHVEPTGSIEPVPPVEGPPVEVVTPPAVVAAPMLVTPAQVPEEVLAAIRQNPGLFGIGGGGGLPEATRPSAAPGVPGEWTPETSAAVRRIGEIVAAKCPMWQWAPWVFIPSEEQVNQALIEAGFKSIDGLGEDVPHDPEGKGRAQIQTVNWDAHYRGKMTDPTKFRVVSDGRPENGGIFPIIGVGTPDPELFAEDIVLCLQNWERRYGAPEEAPAPAPAAPEAKAGTNGSTPVSGVMAWACGLCSTVVRQAADGTMPSFVCPGCGATHNWRQPTIDELAGVTPTERAAMTGAQPYGVGFPSGAPKLGRAPVPGPQGDNDFYAQRQGAPVPLQQQFAQPGPMEPDPETRALVDICWFLEGLTPDARTRVVRYIKDRWS